MNPTPKRLFSRLICLVWIFIFSYSSAQSQQFLTKISGWNAYVHLPDDYNSNPTAKYPLIVFWPGVGEVGTDASKLLVNGPSRFISQGWNGQVTVGGKVEKPIIISLQPATAWPQLYIINEKLDSIEKRWRVDANRIYFTGLSHGGWITNCMVSQSEEKSKKLAATVAMSAVIPVYPYSQFNWFAQNGGKTWQLEGNSDLRGNDKIIQVMNNTVTGSARYTVYNGGHCCWNTYYNPQWRENGESIYEWMLKHSRNATQSNPPAPVEPPANKLPVVNAGTNQTIILPNNQVTFTATANDSDGSIATYQWSKIAGPSTFQLSGATTNKLSATTLVAGTYSFRLAVTDNVGGTAADTVSVVVLPAPPSSPAPESPTNSNCKGKRFTLQPGPFYINLAGKVFAGDTIVVPAGDYGFIELSGLDGTAECPIVIINQGGQAKFEAFNFGYPAHHVKMIGTGAKGVPYGFRMANKSTKYWGMHLKCEGPLEVGNVEITNANMGIQLKDDFPPQGFPGHFGFVLHNLYIHDIPGNEGLYIGSSTTPTAPKVKGVHLYDILVERTGREGLQVSNAQNVLIERVKIIQPSLNNTNSQNHSFNLGHDVEGTARNMYIQSAPSYNVFFSGGRIKFECSTIDHSFSIFPQTDALFGKNYEFNASTWVETFQQFTIRDIHLKNSGGVNIASITAEGPLQPNIVENIKTENVKMSPWAWGPNASVKNVGPNISFSSGCTPPQLNTMWTPDWPATSPVNNNPPPPPPPNKAPTANAGTDITITLPTNQVSLNGVGTDSDGSIASYQWTKISGPTSFQLSGANTAQKLQ